MYKTILYLLIFSSVALANGKPTAIDQKIMNLGLNFEFEEADRLLKEQIVNSESLKNHFLYLNIELLKVIQATDAVPFKEKRAVKDSLNKKLIDYAENVVEKYEDEELTGYNKFYFGSIYGILGRLYGVSREMMSAFSAGKEGRNIMEELVEEDPNFIDAYLLLGMMNYYADRLGGFIEFVAGILGLSGDRSVGLKYLERVEKEGLINNWQATMILIELYSRMESNKFASLPLLEKITKRFPNNTHFKNWLSYEYLSLYQLDKAGELIKSDTNNTINDFVKALYYSQAGEFEKSNSIYNELLVNEGIVWPSVYENAKYNRVMNYFYLGNDESVQKYSTGLNERYSNIYKEISERPELSKLMFKLRKAVLLNENNIIAEFLQNPPDFQNSKITEASYNYNIGVYYFKNSDFENAERYFLKSKEISFDDFGYTTSRFLIHIYLIRETNIEKVEKLMDDIDDLDSEDLEFFAQDLEEKYDL